MKNHAKHAVIAWMFFAFACWSHSVGDAQESSQDETLDELPISDFDRDHWAYRPVRRVVPPGVNASDRVQTPIDRFILGRLEKESVKLASRAEDSTLLRRVTLDITGLPPTPDEVSSFLKDERPRKYERLVDSLLASPEYGKRWGQHWLDLARFAETDGFEHDKIRPDAWKYRDWVIDAFNVDMAYDRFVRWQLAGDLIAPGNPQAVQATAFCCSGPDMPDINSQQERRHVLLNEITSTVGAVFMSLQVGCAQCHDHKFDAISQADFYRLRAFFEPAVSLKKNRSINVLNSSGAEATSNLMVRGDWRRKGPELPARVPRLLDSFDGGQLLEDATPNRKQLAAWLTDRRHPLTARVIVNRIWQHHFGRGLSTTPSDFGVMGDEPIHVELLDYLADDLMRHGWSLKRLHRMILLSAVYQTRNTRPPQPADAVAWDRSREADPDNLLLSRFPRRRLEAEVIRDSLLATSGLINHEVGGPGIRPNLPREMVATLKSGQWKVTGPKADHYRRSIYIFARRNLRYPFFATFDRPTADLSCARRDQSTTAVQSLLLLNSEITLQAARKLAGKLLSQPGDPIEQAYLTLYGRIPSEAERRIANEFLKEQAALLRSETRKENLILPDGMASSPSDPYVAAAHVDLCRAMYNANEFVYVE